MDRKLAVAIRKPCSTIHSSQYSMNQYLYVLSSTSRMIEQRERSARTGDCTRVAQLTMPSSQCRSTKLSPKEMAGRWWTRGHAHMCRKYPCAMGSSASSVSSIDTTCATRSFHEPLVARAHFIISTFLISVTYKFSVILIYLPIFWYLQDKTEPLTPD